ncbi:protein PHYTOCHROME KINASE SUBSTRATE 1-like [Zingiber officinale]|uniref:Uncharacterized protein n=1 Tax=Zingiber officinale TaxID=94328 RepID=A0A8J5F267_ZINOF|nr:protein PHYTOCHROME KINASE SUBSTRATE 1-like [Zingiber officinale]KAG6479145.1 hypothetical protein ZIOFF_062606 [Zingiber officinale]
MGSVKVTPKSLFAFDDSFSSYLAFVRENSFPPELGNSASDHLACQITFSRRRSRSTPDGEIEIFDAEKYFSGVMDGSAASGRTRVPTPSAAGAKKEVPRLPREGSKPGSTASETSCNSRSVLLPDRRRRDSKGKKFLRVFPCTCARKQAINVDREAQLAHGRPHDGHSVCESRLKRISPSFRRQEPFSLPPNPISKFKPEEKVLIGVAQNSILGANFNSKNDLTIAQSGSSFAALPSRAGGRDEDVLSEASSDLFEIEGLSTSTHHFFTIKGSESATATAAVGYEPSEASVEWSVVTASVANFSMSSESGEQGGTSLMKTRRSSGSGHLLGCVSEKAVDVTGASGGSGTKALVRASARER